MSATAPTRPHRYLRCTALLQKSGWLEPAFVQLDAGGRITAISAAAEPDCGPAEPLDGWVIPGFQNAHSHAFQYAMAGLAEHTPTGATTLDNFWRWRDAMYSLALRINPEQMRAIAAMAYAELLRHGYTAVAEFHYLHQDGNGQPYADPATMGRALMAGAADAGIALTLVPVLYQYAGFGRQAAASMQRRFLCADRAAYHDLLAATHRAAAEHTDQVRVGLGVHSLRAVDPADVKSLLGSAALAGPIHLHIAEQKAEVQASLAYLGVRPVAWLLDNLPVDRRFSLVHATHLTAAETKALAASGATTVLCPSTEGNLADGFFPLRAYVQRGGRFAIGSDSHVGLSPLEELRWLDYGQRLRSHKRNTFSLEPGTDSGTTALTMAWDGGRAALGHEESAFFAVGQDFDAVVLNPEHPTFLGRRPEQRLSALVYAGDPCCLTGTLRRGAWVVQGQRHVRIGTLTIQYSKVLASLHQILNG